MERSPIDQILKPVSNFINQEYTSGIILFGSLVLALIWANSPWQDSYEALWHTRFVVTYEGYGINQPLHIWINDGLMTLFFFVIGLELKGEFMAGELSTFKKASLPMGAALGGMLVPAGIFLLFNAGTPTQHGWGIPMATDIAFAIGLLSIVGKHIPRSMKIFLSALAVADDLGAILVITFFYSAGLAATPLIIAGILLVVLVIANFMGVRAQFFYLFLGLIIWACFLFSGIHATVAGVLVAFTIPARTKIDEKEYVKEIREYTDEFEKAIPQRGSLTTKEQHLTIEKIKRVSVDAETPLQKIEHALHPYVAFIIMPLFALANSGLVLSTDFFHDVTEPLTLGIFTGLVFGKFIGVMLFSWFMIKLGISDLPQNANWRQMRGVALLTGVGFTMSLFISNIAFGDPELITEAKYGIFLASFVSGVSGVYMLRRMGKKAERDAASVTGA